MAGPLPALPDVYDRARLPPVPAAQTGRWGKKESPGLCRNPACQQYDKPSLAHSPSPRQCTARIAENPSRLEKCQSSAGHLVHREHSSHRLRYSFRLIFGHLCVFPKNNPKLISGSLD